MLPITIVKPIKAMCLIVIATFFNCISTAQMDEVTRYVRFTDNSGTHSGILKEDMIYVLNGDPIFDDDVVQTGETISLDSVDLEIPIDPARVPNVLGVAGNSNNPNRDPVAVDHPRWFSKATTSLAKNGAPVEVPFGATNFNFEGELVLIIGKQGRHIPESEAIDYLFGVSVGNDWSENDWCGEGRGIEEPSHVFCKAGDTFATLGDQVVKGLDLSDLQLTVSLNGTVAAQGTTADFRDDAAALISKLSHFITLKRGDMIYTGTVAPPQLPGTRRQLWQDDIVEVEIEGVGIVSNQLVRTTRMASSGPAIDAPNGKYVRFNHSSGTSYGLLNDNEILELDDNPIIGDVQQTGRKFQVNSVELELPIDPESPGRKVLAVAANYHSTNAPPRQVPHPRFMFKHSSGLSGHNGDVERPPEVEMFIPEGELVLVIGREGRHIPVNEANDYIFGVALGNDWSELSWITAGPGVRPLKLVSKATDTWAAIGNEIVRGLDYDHLEISTHVNGNLLSSGYTSTMINNPARLVSYLSRYMTLKPGDLIYTGAISPESGRRRNLAVGDVVQVEIDGLGSMEQQVVDMPQWLR